MRRVVAALHAEGTIGLTIPQLAGVASLKPYEAKALCRQLHAKRRAVLLAARRNPATGDLEEVWGCSCPLDHRYVEPEATPETFRPLDDETKERGRAGVAAARAALEAATNRRALAS